MQLGTQGGTGGSHGSSTGRPTHAIGQGGALHAVEDLVHELADDAAEAVHTLEDIFRPPARPERAWHGAGLADRAERWFEGVAWGIVMLFAAGWAWSIAEARTSTLAEPRPAAARRGVSPATAAVAAALTDADRPSTAYLTNAALEALAGLRGRSGSVRLVQRAPGEPVDSAVPGATADTAGARRSPIRDLVLRVGGVARPVDNLRVVTLTPLSARRGGRIGLYYIGSWPTEGARRPQPNYAPPRGLIEVTRESQDTPVSEHFRIRDFLTHDQQNVWPKYVVIDSRNVDKLELVLADLAAHGIPVGGVHVMSGFRTPQYNRAGGDPSGRAGMSRHMFGDAADIWIDNNGDGQMDDLDRDGRHDIGDAEVVRAAVDRVERNNPELVGGCGVYPGNAAHGPFVHIDARGYRARWIGSGDGG